MSVSPKNIITNNPYPGIRSFNVNESRLFFGREKQVQDLSNLLKKNHFAAISGASGSGKSSIVKAGVIPSFIEQNENADYIIFRPGSNPIKNLSDALSELIYKDDYERKEVKKQLALLNKSENALEQIFTELSFNKHILLYIDQFEEIFRYRTNELQVRAEELSEIFIKNIINAVNSEKINVSVIFSLRSDFLSECAIFEGLPDLINKGHYLLPSMSEKQKIDAITKPAELMGADFSEELMDLLKEHIKDKHISLPVLQHALMRTWDYWLHNAPAGVEINIEHYNAVGTVTKALSVHAEDIYNSLDDEQKKLTEKIFRALTYFGDDERGTRSPQKLGDLCEITGAREMEIITVVDKFRAEGNSFLLPDITVPLNINSIIDISHESIMIVWERLVGWVEKETQSAQLYIRLSKSAELYQGGETGILVNPDLQIAINWLKNDRPNSAWAMRYDPTFDRVVNYIYYSQKEYEKAVAAEQAQKERGFKRARFVAFILGFASLISILFMIVALNLRFKAEQSEKDAISKQKLAERQSIIAEERRREAVALQLIAKQQQDIAEQNRLLAERQKRYAVAQQQEALFQKQQAIDARNEAYEARDLAKRMQLEAERLMKAAIEQKKIIEEQKLRAELSEARTDTLRRLAVSKTMAVQAYKLYFDNRKSDNISDEDEKLPAILALQSYYFNKMNNGNPLDPDIFAALLLISSKTDDISPDHKAAVRDIAVFNSGDYIITAGSDGKLFKLNFLNNFDNIQLANSGTTSDYRAVEISKDNKIVLAGNKAGQIFMWNSDNLSQRPVSKTHGSGIITDIKFINDNSFVVIDNQGKIATYSVNELSFSKELEKVIAGSLIDVDFYNGTIIVATQNGKVIYLTEKLEVVKEYNSDYANISAITVSKNGNLYVGYTNGLVARVSASGIETAKWFAHNSAVTKIISSKNSNRIITSGYDKTIKIWNRDDLTAQPVKIDIHSAWIYSISLSPDEKYLISADANGKVKVTLIDVDELKDLVKGNITQNMSEANWKKYVGSDITYNPDLPSDL